MGSPSAHGRQRCRRDWASLDAGPAGLVAEHALRNDVVDFICFRAACRAWRACSTHLRAQGVLDRRSHPRRWIMLPKVFNNIHDQRRFLNILTGKSIYRSLPVLDTLRSYVVGTTSEGLVLLLGTGVGRLLNPLTGQVAELPSAASLLKGGLTRPLGDLGLSCAGLANDDTVMLSFPLTNNLAVAKSGDERWTRVYSSSSRITSPLPFAGNVYCVTSKNISLVETQTTGNQRRQLVAAADLALHNRQLKNLYRMDWDAKNMVRLHGLGGKALFLGKRRSLLVAAGVSPSITADTAYLLWEKPNDDATAYAVDLYGDGELVETKFKKDDVAYYLSCFVSLCNSEYI
ncbi:hypothetical protein VPH35_112707 [Triticum aestivum]